MFRLAYTELKLSKFCGGNKKMGTLRAEQVTRLHGFMVTGCMKQKKLLSALVGG